MPARLPIFGLPRRFAKTCCDEVQIQVVQQGAVVQQVGPLGPQTIAGKLARWPCARFLDEHEIADASLVDLRVRRKLRPQRVGDSSQDVAVSAADVAQLRAQLVAQYDGIHQAAWAGDDRRPTAGAPQDRYSTLPTDREFHLLLHARR